MLGRAYQKSLSFDQAPIFSVRGSRLGSTGPDKHGMTIGWRTAWSFFVFFSTWDVFFFLF